MEVTAENVAAVVSLVKARREEAARVRAELDKPFEPGEVKFKPGMVKNNRALALAYVDARVVQDRLDDVFGVGGWEHTYRELMGGVVCTIRAWVYDRWVSHEDVGSPSEQPDEGDRLKAAFSDALKRAAVHFGVGRYLYRAKNAWHDYDPVRKGFAYPLRLREDGQIVAASNPPAPRPDHKPDSAPQPTAGPSNPHLVAQITQAFAQCDGRDRYLAICSQIAADKAAGKLTEADRLALVPAAKATAARFPDPAK